MIRRRLRPRPQVLLVMTTFVLAAGMASGIGRVKAREAEARLAAATTQAVERPSTEPLDTPASSAPPTADTAPAAVTPPETAAVPAEATPAPEAPPAPAPEAVAAGAATDAARVAAAVPAPPPAPAPLPTVARIPLGKGMWLHQLSQAGSAAAVVKHAKSVGLTHVYLRVGSSKMGFYGQDELNRLLPAAHAAGLKVVGWDFPYLFDPVADAERSLAAINYVTPDGHRMDSFSADIETASEGVNLTAEGALAYGAKLRELVGPDYPLIATVPRPSPKRWFPFAEATQHFDAIAPMVYWQNRDPANDVAQAIADLAPFSKPVLPIGQAYDGGPEGGPAGPPPKDALVRFMDTALAKGAVGVSFWVWHHATGDHWSAIDDAVAWELRAGEPAGGGPVIYLQRVLNLLGQPITVDGDLGPQTRSALATVQQALGLAPTGRLDAPTVSSLVGPRR